MATKYAIFRCSGSMQPNVSLFLNYFFFTVCTLMNADVEGLIDCKGKPKMT